MSETDAPLFDLSGKVAMVTGASRGLGQYFARALARAGADIVVTSRDADSLGGIVGELEAIGRRAWKVALDVRDQESIRAAAENAVTQAGRVDILVNNAGCNVRKPTSEISWDDWNLVLDTNLRGMFFMTQAIVPGMIDRGWGRVVNIGSVTNVFGYAGMAPYCASRGGVRQMTMSFADEWGKHGITVNSLAPGWFKTKQNAVMYEDEGWLEYLVDRIPVGRPGLPSDLDGAVVFLASEASCYVSGQTLLVDGGITTGSTRALPNK